MAGTAIKISGFVARRFFPNPNDIQLVTGFRSGLVGTQTSRTLMLSELTDLFEAVPPNATRRGYAAAIIEQNCVAKPTAAARRETNVRLGTLYALDSVVPMFRVLRRLWEMDKPSRPLFALLVALARDPLLRATAGSILSLPTGGEFQRSAMRDALRVDTKDRLGEPTLNKVVRNAASSWTQSGHLAGRTFKIRHRVTATPAAIAFALYLGQNAGFQTDDLFSTGWMEVLDCGVSAAQNLAIGAKRMGLIDLRMGGGVLDLELSQLDPENTRRR
ncbi:MAG: hypothetical protein ACRD4O_12815 [Bryobacteraceae bacterium]